MDRFRRSFNSGTKKASLAGVSAAIYHGIWYRVKVKSFELDELYHHEVSYFAFSSQCEITPFCWFLSCPELPASREVNRALRVRNDGRGPSAVVSEVVSWFRAKGLRVSVEIDEVSESQRIGFELRRLGIAPVTQARSLMVYAGGTPSVQESSEVEVIRIDRESQSELIGKWIETNLHDVKIYVDSESWRTLAIREARTDAIDLYLAMWRGQPAATCSLYCRDGAARIEMVETRTEFRRRGLASAVVSRAISVASQIPNQRIYLFTDAGSDAERLYRRIGFEVVGVDVLQRHIEGG